MNLYGTNAPTIQRTNSDDPASSPESDLHEGWSDMDAVLQLQHAGTH